MPLPPLPVRSCACGCGDKFIPTRADMKYATNSCKMRAYHKRRTIKQKGWSNSWWQALPPAAQCMYADLVAALPELERYFAHVFRTAGYQTAKDTLLIAGYAVANSTDETSALLFSRMLNQPLAMG